MRRWVSRFFTRPVSELAKVARQLAEGNYDARVVSRLSGEHGRLGATLNLLAEKFQESIRELSLEKGRLCAILANMVEAVVAIGAEDRILAVNPALCRLFGVNSRECIGKPFLDVFRHSQLNFLLAATKEGHGEKTAEIKVFTPEERTFEAHAVPLVLEDGKPGALLVLHDITRLRALEQLRRDFVANVSHELHTPLASIKAFAETLLAGALEDPDHRREFVEAIEKDADRMTSLVEDLLHLAFIESGRQGLRLEPVSLADLARDETARLKPLAEKKKIKLDCQWDPAIPLVRADKNQIRQVVTNFLDNAIKFNKEGGRVGISADVKDGFVALSIEDTGIGIPSEDLARIFERFYRVDKARSRELGGTGLGLAIVKHIAESHGGSVSVESVEGKGSVFRLTLPINF